MFAAERQQQLDLDKKVSEEMARYNKMQDIELARRRKVQEMQLQNMMQSLEQMKKEKIDRKRQQVCSVISCTLVACTLVQIKALKCKKKLNL